MFYSQPFSNRKIKNLFFRHQTQNKVSFQVKKAIKWFTRLQAQSTLNQYQFMSYQTLIHKVH